MPPARGPDGRFKPKQPKARKKKTTEQRKEIAKRNRAESERQDDVAKAQRKQQDMLKDPRKYLTEGMSAGASREVLKQYDRVLEYNARKAQDELGESMGQMSMEEPLPDPGPGGSTPTYSPGSPPSTRVSMGGADGITQSMGLYTNPKFPPGVKIKMKNPTSEVRRHNKDVQREIIRRAGWVRDPVYPGNQADITLEEYMIIQGNLDKAIAKKKAEFSRVSTAPRHLGTQRMTKWEQMLSRLPNPDVQDYVARQPVYTDTDPSNPFAPTPQSIADASGERPDKPVETDYAMSGEPGDYLFELEKEREADRALEEVRQYERTQANLEILSNQERQPDANVFREEGAVEVVRLTEEEKEDIKFQAKQLLVKKKQAKTQEEKDYYKRALEDLKEGETQAVKSRRRQREERQIASAPVSFKPQVAGVKKYPGPANIQGGFAVVSREIGRRDLTDDEAQHYMGGGVSGTTQTYTSGEAEVNDEYQRYASRKTQSLSGLRTMGGTIKGKIPGFDKDEDADDGLNVRSSASIPVWGSYEKLEGDTDEEELTYLEDTYDDPEYD